jgi:Ran GTPase-activating protein (RanGAP) involved in mRNA processing and transport
LVKKESGMISLVEVDEVEEEDDEEEDDEEEESRQMRSRSFRHHHRIEYHLEFSVLDQGHQ